MSTHMSAHIFECMSDECVFESEQVCVHISGVTYKCVCCEPV